VHYALASASLHSLSRSIRSNLLVALYRAGVLNAQQALAIAHRNPHSRAKASDLTALAPLLPKAIMGQVLSAARSIDEAAPRVNALTAIAVELPPSERADLLGEALLSAQLLEDDYDKFHALLAVGSELPQPDRRIIHDQAISAARSLDDPERRAFRLATVAAEMENPARAQLLREAVAITGSIEDSEKRLHTLTELLDEIDLSDDEKALVAKEALAAARSMTDLAEKASALASLSRHLGPTDRPLVVDEALTAIRPVTDPEATVHVLTTLISNIPEVMISSAITQAHAAIQAIPDEETRLQKLFALTGQLPPSTGSQKREEALALARQGATAAERTARLTLLAENLADSDAEPVLKEALGAVREIEDHLQRVRGLVRIAECLSEERANLLLREAFGIPGAFEAMVAVEADEVEWVEAIAATASHLRERDGTAFLLEAHAIARTIERSYDHARALIVLAPNLIGADSDQMVDEALGVAHAIDSVRDRTETFITLLPMLDPIRQEEVLDEVLDTINDLNLYAFEVTGKLNDDGVVDLDRMARFDGGRAGALLDAALSVGEPHRHGLLRRAFDAVYDDTSVDQAAALASLAPYLLEEEVRQVLSDIRFLNLDPWRAQTLSKLLTSLATTTSLEAAQDEARAIFGEAIPEALAASFATAKKAERTIEQPNEARSLAPGADRDGIGLAVGNTTVGAGEDSAEVADDSDSGNEGQIEFTAQITDFSNAYGLRREPNKELLAITLHTDEILETQQRQRFLNSVFTSVLDYLSAQWSAKDVRTYLHAAREFRAGTLWRKAITALLIRLANLGFADEALAEARSTWGQPLPVEVAPLSSVLPEAHKSGLLQEALTSVRNRESNADLIEPLARLAQQLSEPDRTTAYNLLSAALEDLLASQSAPRVSSVASELSVLPLEQLLPVWQRILRLASVDIRRDLLSNLPQLLSLIEPAANPDFWPQVANSLRTIRKWWP
jgi:hypothetical protein